MHGTGIAPRRRLARLPETTAMLLITAALLTGCSLLQSAGQMVGLLSKPETPDAVAQAEEPQTYQIALTLVGGENMNPDSQMRPSPAQIRLFVTEPLSEIGAKPFEEVFDYAGNVMQPRPDATITIRPGETREIVLPAMMSQTRLVVAVAFRDPYQSIWLAQADIVPQDSVLANVRIDADRVSILPSP